MVTTAKRLFVAAALAGKEPAKAVTTNRPLLSTTPAFVVTALAGKEPAKAVTTNRRYYQRQPRS
jgi:hypothetical protein